MPACTASSAKRKLENGVSSDGFEDHGITGRQCRGDFPGGHAQGEIPRRNGGNHSIRFGDLQTQPVGLGGGNLAAVLVRQLGKEANALGDVRNIPGDHIFMGTGRTHRLQGCQDGSVGFNQIGPATHDPRPLTRWTAGPIAALKSLPGRLDGFIHKVGIGDWQLGMDLAIRGSHNLQFRWGIAVLASNEMSAAHSDKTRIEAIHGALQKRAGES